MARKKEISRAIGDLKEQFEFLSEAGAGFVFQEAGTGKKPVVPKVKTADKTAAPRRSPAFRAVPAAAAPSDVPHPAAGAKDAHAVAEEVLRCGLCRLAPQRTRAVPGEGDIKARLMFVGEAPGRDEDAQGRPFVGRAGQLLRKIIASMNFTEEEVFITNVVKCRPPENRVPARDEVALCSPYLEKQIVVIAPLVIVTLGKTPTDYFMGGTTRSMGDLRGHFFDYKGVKVMPTFHPSYLIRNEGNKELRKMVWDDMQQVMKLLGRKRK